MSLKAARQQALAALLRTRQVSSQALVLEHLRGQGFTVADIRPVDFGIGKPSVRYFFDDDRSASERLVAELGRFLHDAGARVPDQASDFSHFTPKPRPGNVEVWLAAS